jgi:hypothetical protein
MTKSKDQMITVPLFTTLEDGTPVVMAQFINEQEWEAMSEEQKDAYCRPETEERVTVFPIQGATTSAP